MKRLKVIALLVGSGALFGLSGCTDDSCRPSADSPFLSLTSPGNVIHNFRLAYETRDLAEWDALFDPECTFQCSERDRENPLMPDSLTLLQMHMAHVKWFDEVWCPLLSLDFIASPMGVDEERSAPGDTVWMATLEGLEFDVYGYISWDHHIGLGLFHVYLPSEKLWIRKTTVTHDAISTTAWRIADWSEELSSPWARKQPELPVDPMETMGHVMYTFL